MPLFSLSLRSRALLASAVILLAMGAVACTPAKAMMGFKNELVRYRVTVEIETPEGIKIGSAVREVGAYTEPSILPDQGGTSYNITKGEAVVVDLGQRGVVFALLGGDREARVVSRAIRLEGKQLPFELQQKDYPQFVFFRDRYDPKTVEPLLEFSLCPDEKKLPQKIRCIKEDMFAPKLGEGVKLKSVLVEGSEAEITNGVVVQYAPSFNPIDEFMKWYGSLSYGDIRKIGPDSFRRWSK